MNPRSKPPPQPTRRHRASRASCTTARGFTLVELVIVMLLMAIISAVSAARFASRDAFAVQGVADQLVSGLRIAQATAVAQRLPVYVVLQASPAVLQVCLDAACSQPLTPPAGGSVWLADSSGLQFNAAASFSFDASGAPSLAAALQVQVLGGGSSASPAIVVEPLSGHVHSP